MFQRLYNAFKYAWRFRDGVPRQTMEGLQVIDLQPDDMILIQSDRVLCDIEYQQLTARCAELFPNRNVQLVNGLSMSFVHVIS